MKYKNEHKYVILFDRENGTLVSANNDHSKEEFEAMGWRVECSCKNQKSVEKKGAKIVAKIEAEKAEFEALSSLVDFVGSMINIEAKKIAEEAKFYAMIEDLVNGMLDADIKAVEADIKEKEVELKLLVELKESVSKPNKNEVPKMFLDFEIPTIFLNCDLNLEV